MSTASQQITDSRPLVSVVIPTRDRQGLLGRCREALAGQSFPRYEIIVVVDRSSDGTKTILQRFGEDHRAIRFRWFENASHLGANRSRNRAVREAEGDYVAFLDSDCFAEPDWLEKLLAGFSERSCGRGDGIAHRSSTVQPLLEFYRSLQS